MPQKTNIIIAYAVDEEQPRLADSATLSFTPCRTGVGKTQAAVRLMHTMRTLEREGVPVHGVLNIGTAGASVESGLKVGDVIACTDFEDRDMRVLKAYGTVYHTEGSLGNIPLFQRLWAALPHGRCSTGDAFVTNGHFEASVCDMESFTLAAVCQEYAVPFAAVKYVSDIVGSNSVDDWAGMLQEAHEKLTEVMDGVMEDVTSSPTSRS